MDTASHVAEEIEDAAVVMPRSMVTSVIFDGALGFGMILAMLFCMGDLAAALASPTGFPFIAIFEQATGLAGATTLAVIIAVVFAGANISVILTASRMTWAFARERGLPAWRSLSQVQGRNHLPIPAILLTVGIAFLFGLINVGSASAFNALVSLSVAAFYSTYALATAVALHARLTRQLRFGPFALGRAGVPVSLIALAFSLFGLFFSLWPQVPHPSSATMNWAGVVLAGGITLCVGSWFIHGKHVYGGPVRELGEAEKNTDEKMGGSC
jgi:choline transport protein